MAAPTTTFPTSKPTSARADEGPFLCSTCGRTDLPQVGAWDPPVCLECDAALNFEEFEIPLILNAWPHVNARCRPA